MPQLTNNFEQDIDFSKIYSPSRLKLFIQCAQQYFFAYVDPIYSKLKNKLKKMPENIWKFNTLGKAVHNAITLFYYLPLEKRTEGNLLLQLRLTWQSEAMPNKKLPLEKWGGFKSVDEERESYREAQEMLKNFYKICETNPDIIFLPTNDFRKSIEDYKNLITNLSENYDISGKFDLVIKSDDSLHIIDFKTSKKEDGDNFQLRFYKVLAEEKFKIPVEKVSFYLLRIGQKIDFDLSNISIRDIKNEILDKIEMIKSTVKFDPKPSRLCKYCVFKTFCPAKKEVEGIIKNTSGEDYLDDLPF